ncbi:hypothetical protein CORC01_08458 [Colletotrichum orchidophilum]|uniref:Uncharacterized protein n=1 Tax=Colletotrichum orchidophilum TaxID=1209926 RepID=A0A1G4B482_9PEZI|nr:uncharacterized protein CORC01_08458 [Colletotrichum orchidophilum]OHE96240.1 hypothetical protein CORC01_08458 [Colletotrichum orchidophilum]
MIGPAVLSVPGAKRLTRRQENGETVKQATNWHVPSRTFTGCVRKQHLLGDRVTEALGLKKFTNSRFICQFTTKTYRTIKCTSFS